jgi:phosphoribosyl 1,2-cyclic phosphate phosphodiesterase
LVLNALRKEAHLSHFTLDQAIALIQSLQVPQGYLTHLSHQMGLHADVAAELPPGVALAYDGMELTFSENNN